MSLFSARLGLVLLGLGILFLGLYLQKNVQGFQSGGSGITIPSNPATEASAMAPNNIVNTVFLKDVEIRNKFNLISSKRNATDIILAKYLNSDLMSVIHVLFHEVSSYVQSFSDIRNKFQSANLGDQATMSQLVYTVYEQVNILYNIYYTYPSNVISTNTIIKSDSAGPNDVTNDAVIQQTITQVKSLLMGLPTASSKMTEYYSLLLDTTNALTKDQNPSLVTQFNENLDKYMNVVTIQQDNLSSTVSTTNVTYLSKAATDETSYNKVSTAINNYTSFLKSVIDLLASVVTTLQTVTVNSDKLGPIISTIQSRVTTLRTSHTAMISSLTGIDTARKVRGSGSGSGPRERFISGGNPYNQPSPSGTQAQEFRLGKKEYSDEVFSAMKI